MPGAGAVAVCSCSIIAPSLPDIMGEMGTSPGYEGIEGKESRQTNKERSEKKKKRKREKLQARRHMTLLLLFFFSFALSFAGHSKSRRTKPGGSNCQRTAKKLAGRHLGAQTRGGRPGCGQQRENKGSCFEDQLGLGHRGCSAILAWREREGFKGLSHDQLARILILLSHGANVTRVDVNGK